MYLDSSPWRLLEVTMKTSILWFFCTWTVKGWCLEFQHLFSTFQPTSGFAMKDFRTGVREHFLWPQTSVHAMIFQKSHPTFPTSLQNIGGPVFLHAHSRVCICKFKEWRIEQYVVCCTLQFGLRSPWLWNFDFWEWKMRWIFGGKFSVGFSKEIRL